MPARFALRVGVICSVAAMLLLSAVPALGVTGQQQRFERPSALSAVGASSSERYERPYCVAFAQSTSLTGLATSDVRPGRCFETYRDAVAYATGGRLQLVSGASPKDVSAVQLSESALGSTMIGRDYEDPNYDCNIFGPCLEWWVGDDHGCFGGHDYVASSMPSGWDNQVSSTQAYAGCSRNKNFEHPNYAGAVLTCKPNCATMGVMNDATSSKKWFDV